MIHHGFCAGGGSSTGGLRSGVIGCGAYMPNGCTGIGGPIGTGGALGRWYGTAPAGAAPLTIGGPERDASV